MTQLYQTEVVGDEILQHEQLQTVEYDEVHEVHEEIKQQLHEVQLISEIQTVQLGIDSIEEIPQQITDEVVDEVLVQHDLTETSDETHEVDDEHEDQVLFHEVQ